MAISSSETQISVVKLEVELMKCDSCGFTEECTLAYIIRIREKYNDRWICGLCIEAVKDEKLRSNRVITTEEALNRHISFCQNFISSSPPSNFTASEHPIFAMARVFRRNMDSPRTHRSNPSTPIRDNRPPMILRSESCFPSLSS